MVATRVAAGAVATAAAASVTPAFGTPTTAGNFLVLFFASTGTAFDPVVPSGWIGLAPPHNAQAGSVNGVGMGASVLIKPNCGANETAPAVTWTSATQVWAMLEEWTGMGGAAAPSAFDQLGSQQGATGAVSLSTPSGVGDSTPNDLVVCCFAIAGSKTQTLTLASIGVTPAGGTSAGNGQGSFATKQTAHALFFSQVMSSNSGVDTITPNITPSTGTVAYNFFGVSLAPPTTRNPMGPPIVRAQAVSRAAIF